MKTIITHFYNEEYLLPMWLEHHKKYFDFGVLIDYGSTDRSVEICKKICPNWQVIPSSNQYFDARACDAEVEFMEKQLTGWRIALTVTEFLVGDVNKLFQESSDKLQWNIPCIVFAGYDPEGHINTTKPLWEQIKMGMPYTSHPEQAWPCRSLHNFNDIQYSPGRHFYPSNTEDAMIFKYSSCLIGKPMIDRRLQIQHKVPDSDRKAGIAEHHVYTKGGGLTLETLPMFYEENVGSKHPVDCSPFIEKLGLSAPLMDETITVYETNGHWNYNRNIDQWIGGKFDAPNQSTGYHGILQQWWDYYGKDKNNWLLVSENSMVKQMFQNIYPNNKFTTIDYYDSTEMNDWDLQYDLCDPTIPSKINGKYDMIICQATFEHLYDPITALRNIKDLLSDNGVVLIHTHVPGFKYHPWPKDYFRFYPDWFIDAPKFIGNLNLLELVTSEFHIFAAFSKKSL